MALSGLLTHSTSKVLLPRMGAHTQGQRMLSTAATEVSAYSPFLSAMHWAVGGSILGAIATLQLARYEKDNKGPSVGKYMQLHKSFGVAVGALLPLRLGARLVSKIPPKLPGSIVEHLGAVANHAALYATMIFMPATGIAMGMYGGKGLPFFGIATIDGFKKNHGRDGKFAGKMFKLHTQVGYYLQYFIVPLHLGAVAFHTARGQKIISRMLP